MVSFIFLLAALIAFGFCIFSLFSKKFKKSAMFLLILIGCLVIAVFTSPFGQAVVSIATLNHQVMGDAMDGLEAYERTMNVKCKGPILEQCSQASQSIGAVQTCLFSKFDKLSGGCGMFLSNTPLVYPPLSEDKVIAGISFPAGTVVSMSKGQVTSAEISQSWQFSNKICSAGQVLFRHWEASAEDKIKVNSCRER